MVVILDLEHLYQPGVGAEGGDPQQADLILDRACYGEMAGLAKELRSPFLQGYVRLP